MSTSVLLSSTSSIARLTFNRPERLNSFDEQMHAETRDALDRVAGDPSLRVLVLTGAGRAFCAGQDLSTRRRAPGDPPPDLEASVRRNYSAIALRLHRLRIPVVCAVNGVAAGAGANIALGCDIVVAARSASFVQAFCRVGLVPDAGGTFWLPRLVGSARAMGLALLGERLTAEQAAAWGLIWKCVDDAALATETDAIARQLADGPPLGLARIKEALRASHGNDLDAQLELEARCQGELGRTDDYREAVDAFLGKRTPVFRGQ